MNHSETKYRLRPVGSRYIVERGEILPYSQKMFWDDVRVPTLFGTWGPYVDTESEGRRLVAKHRKQEKKRLDKQRAERLLETSRKTIEL